VAIAGAWMHRLVRKVANGKQSGEEQQDSEQTCKRGIGNPLCTD